MANDLGVGIETINGILDAIQKMSNLIPKAPNELTEKYRWMNITIFNQTQFKIIYTRALFKSGRPWTAPTNIGRFDSMTFSVCNKDVSFLQGVTGGAVFQLQIPQKGGGYHTLDIAVGFARPGVGTVKCSALFSSNPDAAWEQADTDSTRRTSGIFGGTNVAGGQVAFDFLAVASPGAEARVTITQQILREVVPQHAVSAT